MDGNLILGGYDAAKVQGAEYTQPILRDGQCAGGLIVTVTNIMMKVNGTPTDVLDSSPMQMCIHTDYELITIPNAVWSNMGFSFCENRAEGLNLWGCNFPTDQIYTGDLQFIFNNSVVITIPNSQLVQTDNGFDSASNLVYNNSVRELMLTNSAFEDALSDLGYSDEKGFQGVRRIRGPRQSTTPWNAHTTTIQTPKEIVDTLRAAGLDPDCFWIEYSTTLFDYKCMRVLIERAGYSVESILPPPVRCWSVVQDFARSLPGPASYKLGRIVRLMNPKNPNLRYLHYSAPDTAALYDLLHHWIDVWGQASRSDLV